MQDHLKVAAGEPGHEEPVFVVPDDSGIQQGLFCQHCYDEHGKQARLQPRETGLDGTVTRYLKCPACDATFDG